MSEPFPVVLRPAHAQDFAFCQRLYFEGMREVIETLRLDMARQHQSFARQWQVAEVRIIKMADQDIGWMQSTLAEGAIFLGQLYLDGCFQRQGIGGRLVQALIDEAGQGGRAIILGVVKINPARRLYERLGFRITHEDQYKFYMRREPDRIPR
jgi:GNAT superfamily N-acetyltransferase